MKKFSEYVNEGAAYDKADMKEIVDLIDSLDKKLDDEDEYEQFMTDLDNVGLDTDVARAIDNAVGRSKSDIKKALDAGLKAAYDREGTEPRPALDLALSSLKKLIKKI